MPLNCALKNGQEGGKCSTVDGAGFRGEQRASEWRDPPPGRGGVRTVSGGWRGEGAAPCSCEVRALRVDGVGLARGPESLGGADPPPSGHVSLRC